MTIDPKTDNPQIPANPPVPEPPQTEDGAALAAADPFSEAASAGEGAAGDAPAQTAPAEPEGSSPALPALPLPGGPGSHPTSFDPRQGAIWKGVLNEYKQEMAAVGQVPEAAILYYEVGKILEQKLSQPNQAWEHFKRAFQLQPSFTPNIRVARRLATQMGNWNAVVLVIDSEIAATADPLEQGLLYLRRGRLLEEKMGKAAEALENYQKAAELAPVNVEILKQLERVYIAASNWKKVLDVRVKLVSVIQDPKVRVQLLLSSAKDYQVHFQDQEQSERMCRLVLEMEPENADALAALRLMYEGSKKHEELLEILKREAQIAKDAQTGAWLFYQAARLLRERMGDEEKALELLRRAVSLAPLNNMVLTELAQLLENQMLWEELVKVFDQQTRFIRDRNELVSLHFKMGTLWEERLFDDDRAIEHYRIVLQMNPSYLPVLKSLGKLYYRKGLWPELTQMFEVEIRDTQDAKTKSTKLYRLAEVLEERLHRDEDAIQKYRQCLELSPGYLPALKTLGRLYTKYHRWEQLVQMYENELSICGDLDQAVFLLDKIGTIWDEKLDRLDKAIESYQRLLEVCPSHLHAIRTLGKLFVRAERWDELIKINEREILLVNDQKQVISLLHRNGEIFEEKLNDKNQAVEMYKKVLTLSPTYVPALQSLGRIYFIKGRWEDLIAMNRQEIEVTENVDQQIALLYKIGELHEEKLIQEDRAIQTYHEVLKLQPNNFPAMKALIRIYTNKRDWENLIEISRREADALEDGAQKALSLFRIAEIWEHHMGDTARAKLTLQEILGKTPSHAPTLASLIRLYTKDENWAELLEVFQQALAHATHESQQLEFGCRLAELYANKLGDLTKAADCYEKNLAIAAGHLPSLEALERIYLVQRNTAALIRTYERWAKHSDDHELIVALLSQIAELRENRLQPAQNAGENYVKILELSPGHPEVTKALDLLYHKYGTWKGLELLYERALPFSHSDIDAVDLCMLIGDVAESRLADMEVAERYYEQALALSPDHLPAVKAMRRIHQSRGESEAAIRMMEQEARLTKNAQQAIAIFHQLAEVYLAELGKPEQAIECLFGILDRNMFDPAAFSRLEALLVQRLEWRRLAALYTAKLGKITEPEPEIALRLKLAGLCREQLGDREEGGNCYRRVVELEPNHGVALAGLADLAFEDSSWDETLTINQRLLELDPDPILKGKCHFRLAVAIIESGGSAAEAAAHFQKNLALDPENKAALLRLRSLQASGGQWAEVQGVLTRLVELEHDKDLQIQYLLELAEISEKHLDKPEMAITALRRILELEPNNLPMMQKLGELYERLERWQDVVDLYRAFIRWLPPQRVQEAVGHHLKIGAILADKLREMDKAVLEFKRAVELDKSSAAAHEALARAYGTTSIYYGPAVDEHRKLLQLNPFNVWSYHQLRRIFQEQKAYDKVFCVCEVVTALRAAEKDEGIFYKENRAKVPEGTGEQLAELELDSLLIHPDERGLVRGLLRRLGPCLTKIYPPNLERHGVSKVNKCRPEDALCRLAQPIATSLGATEGYDIYLSGSPIFSVAVENTDPPAIIVGEGLLKRATIRERRFALTRALKLVSDGSYLALNLGVKELTRLVAALLQPYHHSLPLVLEAGDTLEDLPKKVQKALPRKNRKAIEEYLVEASGLLKDPIRWDEYLMAVEHSANRAGLVYGTELYEGILHLARAVPDLNTKMMESAEKMAFALSPYPTIRELLRFAVSEEYFRLRARLKLSIA